jgi:hypothetical protein
MDMKKDIVFSTAGKKYEAAHAAHYTKKNLHEALVLYKGILAAHPDTREAEYSRSQLMNIVNSVVPKQELLDAQVELALALLVHEEPADADPAPATLLAPHPPR